MAIEDEIDPLADSVHAALTQIYKLSDDALVNRWILAVELINADGRRGNAYLSSPDMRLWEVIGMAECTSEYARTQLAIDYIGDEDIEDVEDE